MAVLAYEALLMLETLKELVATGGVLTFDSRDTIIVTAGVNFADIAVLPTHGRPARLTNGRVARVVHRSVVVVAF